jgi:hypothetical protein
MKTINFHRFVVILTLLGILAGQDIYLQTTPLNDSRGNPVPEALLKKLSISYEQISLIDALTTLAEQGEFYLNYNLQLIPADMKVSGRYQDVPAVFILQQLLKNTDIGFVVTKTGQIVLVSSLQLDKEKKYTISGFITDAKTGEALIGTNVLVKMLKVGCTSNMYGFYSMTLPVGDYTIYYSFLSYETRELVVKLDRNVRQNIELNSMALSGDTVVVNADFEDNMIKSTEMGTFNLVPARYRQVPVFLGEQDIIRTLQLLPGVTQTREADCGFYVRGGNSDQNLVLLDEAPVYNAVHLLGIFSVFNSDVIKDAKLIKGSAPPKYGGKLSSVLDIQMKEGSMKEFAGKVGVGTIFSRATLEGPIIKDRASFIVSGRRTYLDIFTKLSSDEELKNSKLYFYDFNLKSNYRLSDKDRFYLSGYVGRDVFDVKNEDEDDVTSILWENRTATLRWNHLFNQKLFSNYSFVYSRFKYGMGNDHEDETVDITSLVKDATLKADFQYFDNPQNVYSFGFQFIRHLYEPSQWVIDGSEYFDIRIGQRKANELALYFSREHDFKDRWKMDYGIRYWLFSVAGQKDLFELEQMDDIPYEFYHLILHNDEQKLYNGFEPRIMTNYLINSSSSIKIGYARNYQNVHMLSNSTSGTPLNVWHPSSSTIKPQRADQISLGYFRNIENRDVEMSCELFYKKMYNQLDYQDGSDLLLGSIFESELAAGQGWAYGIELFLKKRTGRLGGWVGYTWSRSLRKFDEINYGNTFSAKNDLTHDFAIVSIYQITGKLILSCNWIYQTGMPVTIPYGNYLVDGRLVNAYTLRNAYRMPAYHRLDIGLTWQIGNRSELNFTLYNAYGRKNAYAILFDEDKGNPQIIEPVRLSLFSFVPSVSYQITF